MIPREKRRKAKRTKVVSETIASVNLPRVFVVESHDVHHLVLDVPHEVRAARDRDLLRKKRESAENVSSQIRLKVFASSLL